jgi:hypothetical protein
MINIGTIKKSPGTDKFAYDLDIFSRYNVVDYLYLFPQDAFDKSMKFLKSPKRETFAELPAINQEIFDILNKILPDSAEKYQFLENIMDLAADNKYGIFLF